MVDIRIKNLTKRYGDIAAVDDISIDVEEGELFFLLGPSGCGKTTILRSIAGFCTPDGGEIYFGERRIDALPPHERNTGMVFQNYALWPHLSVRENLQYGLDVRKIPKKEKRERVDAALAMVRMSDQAGKRPNQLSGGQQQRVALARALVINPDVVLLDEPLSNLDAKLRGEMRGEIHRIHEQTKITTIYVTHDQKEALSLADRIAVMNAGHIERIGRPRDIYDNPTNRFVAEFIGETNLIPGKIKAIHEGLIRIETAIGDLVSTRPCTRKEGEPVTCSVRHEAVQIASQVSGPNVFHARVTSHTYLGEVEQFEFDVLGRTLRGISVGHHPEVERGGEVRIAIAQEDVVVLDDA
ncbi:MAG: ABC transporter ATP-binding protein [Planctomycetes bacterium]|nr:ABC transporter ATP-binding protein [Planctomycetota bacterium]